MSFTSIPSTYTDLCVLFSARNTSTGQYAFYRFNNDSTSNYSARFLYGDGSSNPVSATNTYTGNITSIGTSGDTANTFGNGSIYIPNYTGSNKKSSSSDSVNENNATLAYAVLTANLWNGTSAITQIDLLPTSGNFAQYSTAVLYGIKNS